MEIKWMNSIRQDDIITGDKARARPDFLTALLLTCPGSHLFHHRKSLKRCYIFRSVIPKKPLIKSLGKLVICSFMHSTNI